MTNDDDKRDALSQSRHRAMRLVKLMGLLKSNRVGDKSGVNTKSYLSATRDTHRHWLVRLYLEGMTVAVR